VSWFTASILAVVATPEVFGAKILRMEWLNLLMALSGINTFGTIFPRPSIARMIL
jgi:hypothetical protein